MTSCVVLVVCSGVDAKEVRGQAVVRQLRPDRRGSILSSSVLQYLLLSVVLHFGAAAMSHTRLPATDSMLPGACHDQTDVCTSASSAC